MTPSGASHYKQTPTSQAKRVLFVRQLVTFSGGHLKHIHYMDHVSRTEGAKPILYLTPDSDPSLVAQWIPPHISQTTVMPEADLCFVAGLDWEILDAAGVNLSKMRVINLIQGIRHAHPNDPRYRFLTRPATRICVSPEIAEALTATGQVNGQIITIPNGLDLTELEHIAAERCGPTDHQGTLTNPHQTSSVFIGGLKNPKLAAACAGILSDAGVTVDLAASQIPRADFLARIAAADVAIMLPLSVEGFYLPALESMALGTPVIVPDCVGARSFCMHEHTCLMPDYTATAICDHAKKLLEAPALMHHLRSNGLAIAAKFSILTERARFIEVLQKCISESESTS